MEGPLAKLIRQKYPGQYDDLSDADLEKMVLAKYPEYKDLAGPEPGIVEKAWKAVSSPLTEAPSRVAGALAEKITEPRLEPDTVNVMGMQLPGAQVRGFAGGALKGIGDLVSGLTSPINLALSTVGLGEAGAALKGAKGWESLFRTGRRALSAPFVAEGTKNVLTGETPTEKLMGGAEIAGGLAGLVAGPLKATAKGVKPKLTAEDMKEIQLKLRSSDVDIPGVVEILRKRGIEPPKELIARLPAQVLQHPEGAVPIPTGWKTAIGRTRTEKGHTFEAEVDWPNRRIIFAAPEHAANPEIMNHEIAHVMVESLPDKPKANLLEQYINLKKQTEAWQKFDPDWIVKNNFHREEIGMDLGDYFSHPSTIDPNVRKLFDTWFGHVPGRSAESLPPNITLKKPSLENINKAKGMGYRVIESTPEGNVRMTLSPAEQSAPETLAESIAQHQKLANAQAEIYKIERAKRFAKARDVGTKGEEWANDVLGRMKGPYPRLRTEPLKLDQKTVDALFQQIAEGTNDIPEQLHAITGLKKILNGDGVQPNELTALKNIFKDSPQLVDMFMGYHGPTAGAPKGPKVTSSLIGQLVNLPRGIQASWDLSFPFRQGLGQIYTKAWWTSWGDMVRSYGSENAYKGVMDSILSRPNYQRVMGPRGGTHPSLAERAGLAITDLRDLSTREEHIMSQWAEIVPGVRASNRAYTAFANKLRADNFDKLIEMAEKAGLNPRGNEVLLREIGDFINNATGRGSLKFKGLKVGETKVIGSLNLEPAAVALNTAFFSPRLIASRLQMLNPRNYLLTQPFVRQQYLKSMLAIGTAWTTAMGLLKVAGAEVNLDPTNADFGKARFGNTRVDMAGGFQQYIVLLSRIVSGQYTSSTTGKTTEYGGGFGKKTRMDAAIDFFANKLAPVPKYGYDVMSAEKYRPFELGDRTMRMFVPMIMQDLSEIAQTDPSVLAVLPLEAIGGGVQTYGLKGQQKRLLPQEWFPRSSDIILPQGTR